MVNRITQRTNNQYGKDPNQLEKAIMWRQPTIDRYKAAGALGVDAMLPIHNIIEKILDGDT